VVIAIFKVLYWHLPRESGENKKHVRFAGNLTQIRTGNLLNPNLCGRKILTCTLENKLKR